MQPLTQPRRRLATRNGQPAYAVRKSGYVTNALIRKHGGYEKALAVLNGGAA
jgi:hypothetical protein